MSLLMDSSIKWLPTTSFNDGVIERHMSKCLTEWGEDWFGSAKITCKFWQELPSQADFLWTKSITLSDDFKCCFHQDTHIQLSELILKTELSAKPYTRDDSNYFQNLSKKCLQNLLERLAGLMGFSGETVVASNIISENISSGFDVADSTGQDFLRIVLSKKALTNIRLVDLTNKGQDLPSGKLNEAIKCQTVSLKSKLGKVTLSVAELRTLRVGDTVVFDTKIGQALTLFADDKELNDVSARFLQVKDGQDSEKSNAKAGLILENII